ncbi:MAG: hypothetical protein AB7I27_06540 [Bacteriovoracaceae bacterium]
MKKIFILSFISLSCMAQAKEIFKCSAQCIGVNLEQTTVHQVGNMNGSSYSSKTDALKDLQKRCEKNLERMDVTPALVRTIEYSQKDTSLRLEYADLSSCQNLKEADIPEYDGDLPVQG